MGLTRVFFCVFLLYTAIGYSQSTDIFRLDYTRLPEGGSDSQVSRYRILFNAPINVGPERYLVLGADYNYIDFDQTRDFPFDDSRLDKLHVIDFNVGYIFQWKSDWRFIGIVTPRLASDFERGIVGRDFLLNVTATLWKEKKDIEKPFRLVVGLTYNSTTGLPVPLPLINYFKRFDLKWSYTLGIPRMDLKYYLTEKHTFISALFLDGYFVNIQEDIILPDNSIGSSISLSVIVGALGYQHNITRSLSFYTWGGYALRRKGQLRDDNRKSVFVLNDKPGLYFRAGFKISIF